jgi:hypothetical protein
MTSHNFHPNHNFKHWAAAAMGMCAALLASFVSSAGAQTPTRVVTENAQARSYGQGWECHYGYAEFGQTCRRVVVPEFGYLNARGDEWMCARGYRPLDQACVATVVPVHGYIVQYGADRGWRAIAASNHAATHASKSPYPRTHT